MLVSYRNGWAPGEAYRSALQYQSGIVSARLPADGLNIGLGQSVVFCESKSRQYNV